MTVEKHPTRTDRFIRNRRFCTRARTGFAHLLSSIWPGRPSRILLPAYVGLSPLEGSGILDPISTAGIPFSFYRVGRKLNIDLESLEQELRKEDVFAVLAVHYFGCLQPEIVRVKRLCDLAGAVLIEDCCHCIDAPGRSIGSTGDYAFFSVHKVLPCDEGGILQCNAGARDPGPLPEPLRSSTSTRRTWRDADFASIAARRIQNYRQLNASLQGVSGLRPFWNELAPGTVPLNLPVLINGVDRFEVYKRMRARGIGVVALYHTLVHEIQPEDFPESYEVSNRILNLPIHQDVTTFEIRAIADALRESLDGAPLAIERRGT